MNSDISKRTIACSSSNKNWARARQSSVLPTPVGPRKINDPIGRFWSCSPARAADDVGDRVDRAVLADDASFEPVFHLEELLNFSFEHFRNRNAGPFRHHFSYVHKSDRTTPSF
jgi:hypothetical protein